MDFFKKMVLGLSVIIFFTLLMLFLAYGGMAVVSSISVMPWLASILFVSIQVFLFILILILAHYIGTEVLESYRHRRQKRILTAASKRVKMKV